MKIGIITVYESIDNLGSYLQAYALKKTFEKLGHEVRVIENRARLQLLRKYVYKINPKREFFLRIIKWIQFLKANKKLHCISKRNIYKEKLDCIIYGSDEIWNLDNPYFVNELFWGGLVPEEVPKIAYAVSVGAMSESKIKQHEEIVENIKLFEEIMARDLATRRIIGSDLNQELPLVCDPTFLISMSEFSKPIKAPKEKFMLVYTYGVDSHMEQLLVSYARSQKLRIISVGFWHLWADTTVECDPLQFASWIQAAECVFTSTFHGTLFTMMNHKRCCILPNREKVSDIVIRMGQESHLIDSKCSLEAFEETMDIPFDSQGFENKKEIYVEKSIKCLQEALKCLEKSNK